MIHSLSNEIEYKKALKEVNEVLKCMAEEEVKKIPPELLNAIKENMQVDYEYKIEVDNFQNQEMSEIAKSILSILYREYWATEKEKNSIKMKETKEKQKIEEEKRENYNPNSIFKSSKVEDNPKDTLESVEIIKYKKNALERMIQFFRKCLKIK